MVVTVIRLLTRSALRFHRHGGLEMAGYLAFLGILSLFPFLFFFVAVAGFFGGSEAGTHFVAFIFEHLPDAVATTLATPIAEVFQVQHGGLLTVGVAGAIWTATTGLEGLRVAVARAEGSRPTRAHWQRRLQSLLMVLVFAGLPTLILLYAPYLWARLQAELGVTLSELTAWLNAGYVFAAGSSFALVWVLYFVLPDRRPRWVHIVPGSAVVVVLSYLVARLFTRIVGQLESYEVVYGSLAGVVLSLLLFYIFGAIFVFGAELNASVAAHFGRERNEPFGGSGNG